MKSVTFLAARRPDIQRLVDVLMMADMLLGTGSVVHDGACPRLNARLHSAEAQGIEGVVLRFIQENRFDECAVARFESPVPADTQ